VRASAKGMSVQSSNGSPVSTWTSPSGVRTQLSNPRSVRRQSECSPASSARRWAVARVALPLAPNVLPSGLRKRSCVAAVAEPAGEGGRNGIAPFSCVDQNAIVTIGTASSRRRMPDDPTKRSSPGRRSTADRRCSSGKVSTSPKRAQPDVARCNLLLGLGTQASERRPT